MGEIAEHCAQQAKLPRCDASTLGRRIARLRSGVPLDAPRAPIFPLRGLLLFSHRACRQTTARASAGPERLLFTPQFDRAPVGTP